MPDKPYWDPRTDSEYERWVCPHCGAELHSDFVNETCPECGIEIEEDDDD